MDGFKYELHLHTSEVSSCAHVSAKEIPKLYQDKGYDVIVVTDHYRPSFFESRKYQKWEDSIDAFLRGYNIMANEGIKCGIRVLLGMELTFIGGPEDYLIYGIDERFLKNNPKLYKKNIKYLHKIALKNNLFIAQAHPFRDYIKNIPVKYLNGIEVINGCSKHNSHNDKALQFAAENNLIKVAGSDFHCLDDLARASVIMSNLADSSDELAQLLFDNDVIDCLEG